MDFTNRTDQGNELYYQAQCPPLTAPPLGHHVINTGKGRSVGTTITLQCPTKHLLVGDDLKCVMDTNTPRWVGEPFCKPLSLYKDAGFQVAVLASIVSVGVICIMSLVFITRCILGSVQKSARKKQKRNLWKWPLEDGMPYFDANLGDIILPSVIPDNFCDNRNG
ncbi:sushi domain-containing protein 3 [Stigmatopora argus]